MALKLHTEYDVAHLEELQRVVGTVLNPEVTQKAIRKNMMVGLAALAGSMVVFKMFGIGATGIVLDIMGLFFIIRGIFFHKICARNLRKRMDKAFTGNDYVLEDECLQMTNAVTSAEVPYEDCTRLLETRQNIYLMMADGQGLILDKSTLEGGTQEELRTLLEEKTGRTLEWVDRDPKNA